jgi:hypothetical protein
MEIKRSHRAGPKPGALQMDKGPCKVRSQQLKQGIVGIKQRHYIYLASKLSHGQH